MCPPQTFDFGSETAEDAMASRASAKARLERIEQQLQLMRDPEAETRDDLDPARLNKQAALALLDLGQGTKSWHRARPLFEEFLNRRLWEDAIEVCEILFRADQAGSLTALGHGVWLAVTFPVNPQITTNMLQYVIDETPDDSDGAAVAAATAAYVYDLRKELVDDTDLYLQTTQMMTTVARRHSDANDQTAFDQWIERLELGDPRKFLVRLRNVIEVMVQDDWWLDRESIQANLPES
jgi:hypothetical protein